MRSMPKTRESRLVVPLEKVMVPSENGAFPGWLEAVLPKNPKVLLLGGEVPVPQVNELVPVPKNDAVAVLLNGEGTPVAPSMVLPIKAGFENTPTTAPVTGCDAAGWVAIRAAVASAAIASASMRVA